MTREAAQLILPALRWNEATQRYECEGGSLEAALEMGVGGFCFFGGRADAARTLIAELRARSRVALLMAADLERGAAQQFSGLTPLPPLASLGSLGEAETIRRAARLTAREARSIGISWDFAPVLDLDVEPENPIVGTRSLGGDAATVAALGQAWIDGCQSERVLACAKHFPGHGRTCTDSHATLPEVTVSRELLHAVDLMPFKAAIQSKVASIMTAHVAYPALEPERIPATLSRRILLNLLRHELGFEGLIVTDALIMEGVKQTEGEVGAPVRALNAGCDLLLYPTDFVETHRALAAAFERGLLSAEHVRQSLERRVSWVAWAEAGTPEGSPDDDRAWAADLRRRVIHVVRGDMPAVSAPLDLVIVDDDVGGPYPAPSREPLVGALGEAGLQPQRVEQAGDGSGPLLVALFGDVRAWKGRPGYSERALAQVREAVASARARGRAAVVVQFSHPRLADAIDAPNVVSAWGGEAGMQRAAAEWLAARAGDRAR